MNSSPPSFVPRHHSISSSPKLDHSVYSPRNSFFPIKIEQYMFQLSAMRNFLSEASSVCDSSAPSLIMYSKADSYAVFNRQLLWHESVACSLIVALLKYVKRGDYCVYRCAYPLASRRFYDHQQQYYITPIP
jgi:hypothetical protein